MTASSSNPTIDALFAPLLTDSADLPTVVPETRESRLIRRAQAGDTAAFRLLVEMHQEVVHRICLQWLQCGEDASEACQDTFIKAWQALPAWQPRGKLSTWLYQIALNQCRDRAKSRAFRQRRRTTSLDPLAIAPACPSASPDQAAIHTDDLTKLQAGLAELPESSRAPLILCAIDGLSHAEAGAILRCSPRAIEGRLYRARQLLLDWWQKSP